MGLLFEKNNPNMKNTAVPVAKSKIKIKHLLVKRGIATRSGYFKGDTGK